VRVPGNTPEKYVEQNCKLLLCSRFQTVLVTTVLHMRTRSYVAWHLRPPDMEKFSGISCFFAPIFSLMCENAVRSMFFNDTASTSPSMLCSCRYISCVVMCDTHFADLRCTSFTWAVCVVLLQCISNVKSKVHFPIYVSYYCNDICAQLIIAFL